MIGEAQVVDGRGPPRRQHRRRGRQLVELYDADPARSSSVPRASTSTCSARGRGWPRAPRSACRRTRGAAVRRPDPAAEGTRRAAARASQLLSRRPELRDRLVVAVVGGPAAAAGAPARARATSPRSLGIGDVVRFVAAGGAGGCWPLVRRRRRRRRAVVQRVVRAGGDRGAGLRHPGRGRRGRRAAHGRRHGRPECWSRATTRRLRRRDRTAGRRRDGARRWHGAATAAGEFGWHAHRAEDSRRVPAGDACRMRASAGGGGVTDAGVVGRRRPRRLVDVRASPTSDVRHRYLPGSNASCRPRARCAVGAHASVNRRSSRATPTRTARRLPAGCWSGTCGIYGGRVRGRPQRRHLPRRPDPAVRRHPDEIDRLLGSVLTYADESFNTILELGFASSHPQGVGMASGPRRVHRQPGGVPGMAGAFSLRTAGHSSIAWTAASSALAAAPSMPTSRATRSLSMSSATPSSSATSRPDRWSPISPPTSSVSLAACS